MSYLKTLTSVLGRPGYLLLAALVAALVFTLAVWLPNFRLIWIVSQAASLGELLTFLWSLYGAIKSNFSAVSATYTIVIAVLFGINVTLLTYYIRQRRGGLSGLRSTGATGIGGLVSGAFGIGCASCGTFIFTSVLALFGAAGILAYLPFDGEEFGFLGVGLLLYSVYALTNKINDPLVCPIEINPKDRSSK